jgi:hypothetical protein
MLITNCLTKSLYGFEILSFQMIVPTTNGETSYDPIALIKSQQQEGKNEVILF